jgi:patatin-like phospholipase/acyl hydrolase
MTYRILSIDGGGIYGAIPAALIERIHKKYPAFLDSVDLYAGTSIGGVISLLLATEYHPNEIKQFFLRYPSIIFENNLLRRILNFFGINAKYSNRNLTYVLSKYFGDKTLANLHKKVLVPSFAINCCAGPSQWRAKIYHNFDGSDSDKHENIVKVALRTTAAPVYFPIFENYIDGTLVDNNPAMCAIAQTQDTRSIITPRPTLKDIKLISLGREQTNHYIQGRNLDYGFLRWMKPLIQMTLDRDSRVVDYQVEKILGEANYHRLAPVLSASLDKGIDNWRKTNQIIQVANQFNLDDTFHWIEKNWF